MSIVPPVPPAEISDETLHFDYPGSDIVLRSELCDSHEFRVPKLYLVNCSPILREIIERSVLNISDAPNGEEREPLPVVKLPESGAILYSLLTLIFPVGPILPSSTENIMELLAAAQKYQMNSVLSHIRGIIGSRKDPSFIRPETALYIYSLAQRYELHQEALQAAQVTLRLPMAIEDLGGKLDFPGMTGAHLYELWKYHERFRNALKSDVLEFRNSGLPDDVKRLRCQIPDRSISDESPPQWLDKYIESVAGALHLFDPVEFEIEWARHIKEAKTLYRTCSCLDIRHTSQLRRVFWEALTAVVHRTIEHVDLSSDPAMNRPSSEDSDPPSVSSSLDIPEPNLILLSSDKVKFPVHKPVLIMSSPFLEKMLSLRQPLDAELVDGLPFVQMSEDAALLNSLVSLLYRIPPIIPGSYEQVFALLVACQKYDMVYIQSYIRAEIQRGTFPAPAKAQAFRAYAIASSLELIPEMGDAALLTLGQPMTLESLGEDLRLFKGQAIYDLIRSRLCSRAAAASNNSSSKRKGNKKSDERRRLASGGGQ